MKSINLQNTRGILRIFPKLFFGIYLCSLGIVMMLLSDIGLDPWSTLNAGLVNISSISFGQWSQIVGFSLIVISTCLKVTPGISSLLCMYLLGLFIDLIMLAGIIQTPSNLILQILMNFSGLFIFSVGAYVYLDCGLGAGPVDGLMLALMHLTKKNVTIVKTSMDVIATVLGLLLGGPFGIGTILVALLGGKMFDIVFAYAKFDPEKKKQMDLIQTYRFIVSIPTREESSA